MAVQQAAVVDFAGKPLIVITVAGSMTRHGWLRRTSWLPCRTNSRHRVVADATHASLVLDETDAAAASQAIRDVVASVRTSRPLI